MEENKVNIKPKKSRKRMVVVILFLIATAITMYIMFRGAYLEKLEIGEKYLSVFWTNFQYRTISIVATFTFIFFTIYVTNKRIASGLKQFFEDEKKEVKKLPNKSISLIMATIVSFATSKLTMSKLILFVNATKFEISDPIFYIDIGYYLFQKPFLEYIVWFVLITLVAVTVYAGVYYVIALNTQFDGVRSETLKNSKITKQLLNNVKIFAFLIAVLTFLKTQDFSSSKFLNIGDKNTYSLYGAGLSDIIIKIWGYRILSVCIVISAFMAISAYNKGKTKKVIASISSVPVYLCALMLVLLGYNSIFVNSNELDKQKKYINYNIEGTRQSYNIDIDSNMVQNAGALATEDIVNNVDLLANVSIMNKDLVLKDLNSTLTNKGYYTFKSSQVGEYNINGNKELLYISPREIVNKGNSYINSTYEYTHGFGVIATSAAFAGQTGNLENYQKSFTNNEMNITQPRIYFGLETNGTIVTNSKSKEEFDYPISDTKNATNEYTGQAGLSLNYIDRFVLACSQGDAKLAFSSDVSNKSKILINRNIIKRAKELMPFLTYDENPYLVITDEGKLVWVLDAYTTSNAYPYAQKTNVNNKEINYIRNSVKVLIDAYDGSIKFYITDRTDPIIMAYRKAYGDLFEDLEEKIPEDISNHFVYPEFLYNVQANVLKRYHTVQADVLYRAEDVWDISTYTLTDNSSTNITQIQPYYTMVRTPGSNNNELGLVIPYTIAGKQNITAYMVGTYENGKPNLKLYAFPEDSNVLGLMQLDTQIQQNEKIYREISSLNVSGTKLTKNMVVVPVYNKLLYVEAIYQQYINEDDAVPTLKKIVVASGNKVAIGNNLQEALSNLVSQNAIGIEIQNTEDINGLIESIIKANKNLEQSTANGDWEMVGKDMEKLQSLVNKLEKVYEEDKKKQNNNSKQESNSSENKVESESESQDQKQEKEEETSI